MQERVIDLIHEQISLAGMDAGEVEMDETMCRRIIEEDSVIPPMQFLFNLYDTACFPRGELVAVTGKEKSGKTFLSSMLMTLCFRSEVLALKRQTAEPLRVLWFDTEQSDESTQDILVNRILPMVAATPGVEQLPSPHDTWLAIRDRFKIVNVHIDDWQDRLPLFRAALRRFPYDLVILDGIRDLTDDINDGVKSQAVIEELKRMTSETHCCMVCVLHQNKSSEDRSLRGWLGTELTNKAFESYECLVDDNQIFTLKQLKTRKRKITGKMNWVVDDNGIPQLFVPRFTNVTERKPSAPQHPSVQTERAPSFNHQPVQTEHAPSLPTPLNEKYVSGFANGKPVLDVKRLFTDAFRPGQRMSFFQLRAVVMNMASIQKNSYFKENLTVALSENIVVRNFDENGNDFYTCPSKLPEPPYTSSPP